MEYVSWENAVRFCQQLSAMPGELSAGRVYRLPTEAEWEYACRARTKGPFHFGVTLNGREANCVGYYPDGTIEKGPYLQRPATVGTYSPNVFGLYDMHGNVWDWCVDGYASYGHAELPLDDPQGSSDVPFMVYRGGCWGSFPGRCRGQPRRARRAAATVTWDFASPSVSSRRVSTSVGFGSSALTSGSYECPRLVAYPGDGYVRTWRSVGQLVLSRS